MTPNTAEAQNSAPTQQQQPSDDTKHNQAQTENPGDDLSKVFSSAREHLTAIEGYKTSIAAAVDEANAAKGEIGETRKAISTKRRKVEELLQAVETKLDEAKKDQEAFTTLYNDLAEQKDSAKKIYEEIETIKASTQEIRDQAQGTLDEIAKAKNGASGLEAETTNCKNNAESNLKGIQEKAEEINRIKEDVSKSYATLLKDGVDAEGRPLPCVQSQIQSLLDGLRKDREESETTLNDAQKKFQGMAHDFDQKIADLAEKYSRQLDELVASTTSSAEALKKTLEADIRALLPDAGAAGLANTYFDAKARYAFVPYAPSSKAKHPWLGLVAHLLQGTVASIFFYALFLAPLIYIVIFFSPILQALQEGKTIDQTVIVFKTILSIPLGAISLFGWSSIRVNRMLYEEYNHKQRVMQLYRSFKDEIETLEDGGEAKDALLRIMLKAVNDKPSLKMHKYDKPIDISVANFDPFALLKKAVQSKPTSSP